MGQDGELVRRATCSSLMFARHCCFVCFFLPRCEITSREYCDFMMGYFHEEATLCSQVRKPGGRKVERVPSSPPIGWLFILTVPPFRCTAWMMSVDCCLSSTRRSQISFTGSGSHSSCTLGESVNASLYLIFITFQIRSMDFLLTIHNGISAFHQ